jgi:hypothetical protein
MKRIDLTGKRFGRWTVTAYAGDEKWFCVCDCTTHAIVAGGELRRGKTRSCGCVPRNNLTGKRFGRWVVTAYAGRSRWACICDCGTRAIVNGYDLRRGKTKSCGCCPHNLPRIDLTGKRFGRWRVIAYAGNSNWSCVCDCDDARVVVDGNMLRRGESKSCGCLRKELAKARATKHGLSGTPEYSSWAAMMNRCYNPRHRSYENYGGRGILVSKDWHTVPAFFADVAPRLPGTSLDRKDVNGHYAPDNWRWADAKTQIQNRRPKSARAAVKRCQVEPPPLDDPPF